MREFFLAVIFLLLFIDTGFWSGLRGVGLLILVFCFLLYPKFYVKGLGTHGVFYLLMLLSLLPSILLSNGGDQSLAFAQMAPFLLYPVLLLFVLNCRSINYLDFLSLFTVFFSGLIIGFFILRVAGFSWAESLAIWLHQGNKAGYFDFKVNLFFVLQPVVYFKATLFLVPIGLYCFKRGRHGVALLSALALFIAPSRAGFFIFVLGATYIRFGMFVFIPAIILLSLIFFFLAHFLNAGSLISGALVRFGHIDSIVKLFSEWDKVMFGYGPGTFFYSEGFGRITDGVEVAPLEYLRRHGVLSLVAYMAFWFSLVRFDKEWLVPVICFWLVSCTNPVLFVFNSFVFAVVIFMGRFREFK